MGGSSLLHSPRVTSVRMPLLSLLFIAAGVVLFIIDALIPQAPPRVQSWGLALATTGFALVFLLDDVDLVTF